MAKLTTRSTATKATNGTTKLQKKGNKASSTPYTRPGRKTATAKVESPSAKPTRPIGQVNDIPNIPSQKLNVYVFGAGSMCELGLGPNGLDVKRPRLNPLLSVDEVGIVSVATGGAHVVAIDHNGKLWSWGQNDSGNLGRNTTENTESEDYNVDNDLNALESTPSRVEGIPEKLNFVDVAATDNLSAAITDQGHVWAWGTFIDDGNKAFKSGVEIQKTPIRISQISGAVAIAGGKDHLLIVDKYGYVHSWGTGQSYQLGVAVKPSLRTRTFGPLKIKGLKNIKSVAAGEYHSFAIDHDNNLWAWGLNNFGQCGIWDVDAEENDPIVKQPTLVTFFEGKQVAQVAGGNHHSLILTLDGDIYAVGEMNFNQLGIPTDKLPPSTVREKNGTPSFVPIPTKLTDGMFDDEDVKLPKFKYVAAGTDHSLAISKEDGSTWTWGFGGVYQLGHGKPPGEDEPENEDVPTRIKNTATTGVTMVFAGAGGQFSLVAGLPKEE